MFNQLWDVPLGLLLLFLVLFLMLGVVGIVIGIRRLIKDNQDANPSSPATVKTEAVDQQPSEPEQQQSTSRPQPSRSMFKYIVFLVVLLAAGWWAAKHYGWHLPWGTKKHVAIEQGNIPNDSSPDSTVATSAKKMVHIVSPYSSRFFVLTLESVEATPEFTKLTVSWSSPRSRNENASVSRNTVLRDGKGTSYQIQSINSVVPLGGKVPLIPGNTILAELIFPPIEQPSGNFFLDLADLWGNGPFTMAFTL